MTPDERRLAVEDYLSELLGEAVLFDGLDEAIVGVASQYPQPSLVVYDRELVVAALVAQGMTDDEAWDWYGFNIADLYAGPGTPLVLIRVEALA